MKKMDITYANTVLKNHLTEILSVKEWASKMGYSRTSFQIEYRNTFGRVPKLTMKDLRLQQFRIWRETQRHLPFGEIARKLGLRDERALYGYVKYHTGKAPTEF